MSQLVSQDHQKRIEELKSAIEELEKELEQEQQKLLQREKEQQKLQRSEIDRLEDYFFAVEDKFTALRIFWRSLKKESKE
jgi:prefoldin subunit 5